MNKNIFAYIESEVVTGFRQGFNREIHYEKIRSLSAISEDCNHRFDFAVDESNYDSSTEEMCRRFESFCRDECGFSNTYDDIWFMDDFPDDVYLTNPIEIMLGQADWCCLRSIEFLFSFKNVHLENRVSFEDFKTINVFLHDREPEETMRLYKLYKEQIDKESFSEDEVDRMFKFVQENLQEYFNPNLEIRKINLNVEFSLEECLYRLSKSDKSKFESLCETICDWSLGPGKDMEKCDYRKYQLFVTVVHEYWENNYPVIEDKYDFGVKNCKVFRKLKCAEKINSLLERYE